jgi:di/tricarboxylate transporter
LSFVRKIADALRNVTKAILGEYVRETENAVKKRLQRLLITGIIVSVLLSLVICLIGAASIFILVGSLKYLSTFMPEWKAWGIIGLTSGVIGGLLFLVLFIIIRKQLRSL